MGNPNQEVGRAEALLAIHDELDALDEKESYVVLSIVFFIVAAALLVFGLNRESVYLLVNGFLSAVGGVILGGWEVSKLRKKRALRRTIDEIEARQIGPPDPGPSLGPGE